jgi:type IV pilus assembly protein PilA
MFSRHGFTLLELLVVMTIVGILTAVAVPQYAAYHKRAFDTRARMDLYHVALAEEAYFVDSERYLTCADEECKTLPGVVALSKGVTLAMNATPTGFTGTASHPQGTGRIFSWDSSNGGMLE